MIKWLARLEADRPVQLSDILRHHPGLPHAPASHLVADQQDDHVRVGVLDHDELVTLALAREMFTWAAAASKDIEFRFVWMSSQVETASTDLSVLQCRWDETEEPPVLSIIALELGQRLHVTRGLAPFVGHEVAVRFAKFEQSRDAARSVVRLARAALMNGPIVRHCDYEGIDGRTLDLHWSDDGETPAMVTIVF